MAITRIIYWLGCAVIMIAALMAITAFAALLMVDLKMVTVMGVTAICLVLLGSLFVLTTTKTPSRETNSDALVFLLLFWGLIPLTAAIPYWITFPELGLLRGYFTAVSALTTTGANGYVVETLPSTLILWQSLLQFFGGIFVATFAVVILAALNLTGTGIHRSALFTLKKGELFTRLIGIGRVISGVYLLIASICFVLMALGGTNVFDALCLSLSGVSTGGMTPRSEDLFLYVPRFSTFVLMLACGFGAMNVAVVWDAIRMRNWMNFRRLLTNIEHRTLIAMGLALTLFGLFYAGIQNLFPLFVESVFFISTAGFVYDPISLEQVPSVVLISLALIGGSALSTAGGLKIIRIILLFKHLGTDISRSSHPSRVLPVQFKHRQVPDRAFLSIWLYFFGYTLVFGLGIVCLGAVGLNFTDATSVSGATLSNIGPLLPSTLPDTGLRWPELTQLQMLVSSALMLIGRVEVLAVLVLMSPSFWRQ